MTAWNATHRDYPASYSVLNDMTRTLSWALLHQAGSLTYPHHDTSGQLMWLQNYCRYKFWVVCRMKPELLDQLPTWKVAKRMAKVFESKYFLATENLNMKSMPMFHQQPLKWQNFVDTELVVVGPGDHM